MPYTTFIYGKFTSHRLFAYIRENLQRLLIYMMRYCLHSSDVSFYEWRATRILIPTIFNINRFNINSYQMNSY